MLAPQHAVSLCKSVGSPARWAANEKVLPSLHAGPTVSFYYWDLIFCVRYSVAAPQEKVGGESKERRMRRVRRGSARKRLDTINSESEYSVRFCVSTKMWLTLKNIFL